MAIIQSTMPALMLRARAVLGHGLKAATGGTAHQEDYEDGLCTDDVDHGLALGGNVGLPAGHVHALDQVPCTDEDDGSDEDAAAPAGRYRLLEVDSVGGARPFAAGGCGQGQAAPARGYTQDASTASGMMPPGDGQSNGNLRFIQKSNELANKAWGMFSHHHVRMSA